MNDSRIFSFQLIGRVFIEKNTVSLLRQAYLFVLLVLGLFLAIQPSFAKDAGSDVLGLEWLATSDFSDAEKLVASSKKMSIACLMRELRLLNPYPGNSLEYKVWDEQAQLNIPILILASLYLDTFCKENKKTRLLFSSRGCCHVFQLFKKLFPLYESFYFHTSRYVYNNPSQEYIQYVRALYDPQMTIIVDEQGTGKTCLSFFTRYFFCLPCYMPIVAVRPTVGITSNWGNAIERVNYAQEGTLAGFDQKGPIRIAPEYPVQYLLPAYMCVDTCLTLLDKYDFGIFDKKLMDDLLRLLNQRGPVLSKYIGHQVEHKINVSKSMH